MAQRVRRNSQSKKSQRLASLRRRRITHAAHYEALERRQRREAAHLQAARRRFITASAHAPVATLKRRRREYIRLSPVVPSPAPPRAALVSLVIAFVLPLVVAAFSNLTAQRPNAAIRLTPVAQVHPRSPAGHVVQARARGTGERALARLGATRPARAMAPQAPAPERHAQRATIEKTLGPRAQSVTIKKRAPAYPAQTLTVAKSYVPPAPVVRRVALAAHRAAPHVAPASPWSLTPDGTWVATIHAPQDARDVSFDASTGQIIALEPSAVDGQAAIVTIGWSRQVTVTMSSGAETQTVNLPAPDDETAAFAAVAQAVGPHLVNVGWTPLAHDAGVVDYRVYRTAVGDEPQLVATLPAAKHSWRDLRIASSATYGYDVVADTQEGAVEANTQPVSTPEELTAVPASALDGKGMFLYFSSLSFDPRFFRRYNPEAVIAEARTAGIHVIELRMSRGSCAMAQTAASRAWLNQLIDAAAEANIGLVAWTVPRRVTTQDVAQTVAAAAYKTPAGNGFVGVALDLETGAHYMGEGHKAIAGMVQYIKAVRQAGGPHYLIVATVASPELGNHTNADYPYAKIAAYADVMQPMEYWHYFESTAHHEYARGEVAGASAAAVARTRELAGRDIPVDVAGQSVALEGTGAPSGREIRWSLGGAKSAGGIGETFFDWAGTRPDAWAAIQAFDW